ncbi:MAG: subtilisin [Lasallia pustulata]|uniref:tripeptidyl-peptidase II n=1 Tax=Lasallia pustulata TaxID=136370 RepID=A0A5M8PKD9_9LECA|nr:MAG: subtilisin [Lasallia pustulata]
MHLSLLALGALIASAAAAPALDHVVHEKRGSIPQGWWKHGKPHGSEVLPMRIALTQANLDKAEDFLMEVSHPTSEKYGQHWTAKEVAEMFAPAHESVDAVTKWLTSAGIAEERISRSQSLGWLKFDATVKEAENLLKTEYHVYKHKSGQPHVACNAYHVPEHIRPHIDFIIPTVHFDAKISPPKDKYNPKLKKRSPIPAETSTAAAGTPVETKVAEKIGSPFSMPGSGSIPKAGEELNIFGIFDELQNCNKYITPNCLRALYRFTNKISANPKNSYGIVEYTPQAYLQSDLDLFFANFSKAQVGQSPIFDSIDGGVDQTAVQGFEYNGESDLDLEYAMTLVYPQQVTLYQTGDLVEGASFNNFLDAIDGSYCTYEGGDDPSQDGIYPDPYPYPGAYTGPENCGGYAATNVISTSYAYNEADLTAFYEMRQCNEYMKLGLQGVTVLYSSGDYGVAGNRGQCIDPASGRYNNGTTGKFNPSFPGTCPYITSVGATQIKPNASITQPEEACETVIYSGGGFSNVFPLPAYQASAVQSWFANHPPPYGADRFNNSQMTRGFPDVSANGANYVVAVDGRFELVYGTSASSPVFGSVITLVNEARIDFGKGPVGFLNPALYANPYVLNDITQGGNQGCGTPGFMATEGWDPVTGLGTPNFPRLLGLFLGLP